MSRQGTRDSLPPHLLTLSHVCTRTARCTCAAQGPRTTQATRVQPWSPHAVREQDAHQCLLHGSAIRCSILQPTASPTLASGLRPAADRRTHNHFTLHVDGMFTARRSHFGATTSGPNPVWSESFRCTDFPLAARRMDNRFGAIHFFLPRCPGPMRIRENRRHRRRWNRRTDRIARPCVFRRLCTAAGEHLRVRRRQTTALANYGTVTRVGKR